MELDNGYQLERRIYMPRFDMTGPMGRGVFTGRGMGYCASRFDPGFIRGGMGRGRGVARGFGYRRNFYPTLSLREEKEILEEELRYLEEEMNSIKVALKDLEEE